MVKWCKLDYEACTWERETFVTEEAPECLKRWRRFRRLDGGVDRDCADAGGGGSGEGGGGGGEGSDAATTGSTAAAEAAGASGSGGVSAAASSGAFQPWDAAPEWLKRAGGDLHPYQVDGVNWLRHAHKIGKHVILADEMGLGKTVQTLAYLAAVEREHRLNRLWDRSSTAKGRGNGKRNGNDPGGKTGAGLFPVMPSLIVAPLSTIQNWAAEAERWVPGLNVVVFQGNPEARDVIKKHELFLNKEDVDEIKAEAVEEKEGAAARVARDGPFTPQSYITPPRLF